MMPLVVSDGAQISTYSMLAFLLDNIGKRERAPCMGSFSCCGQQHIVHMGPIPRRIPCDKKQIVQVLSNMYTAKVLHLLDVAPAMAFISLGLEPVLYAGAEEFSKGLPTVVTR